MYHAHLLFNLHIGVNLYNLLRTDIRYFIHTSSLILVKTLCTHGKVNHRLLNTSTFIQLTIKKIIDFSIVGCYYSDTF